MQKEIINSTNLLDKDGNICVRGYAKKNIIHYNKENLKTNKLLLKEWDYYYIGNDSYGLALTIADNGYMGLLSISFLDFKNKKEITKSDMILLPLGKTRHPTSSSFGDLSMQTKNGYAMFKNDGKTRKIFGNFNNFDGNQKMEFNIELSEEPVESITMVTPFKKEKRFYYNQKINCLKAEGHFAIGNDKYLFDKKDSLAVLDWGRGVWTYKNTWYWGSLSCYINDKTFGFNIGYGFGDTSSASENVIFYDGKSHKINNVDFEIPNKDGKDKFLEQWKITSNDKRLELKFKPLLLRHAFTNAFVICSLQNQVFGYFSGKAILDDGTEIEFKNKLGFAEKVFNKW